MSNATEPDDLRLPGAQAAKILVINCGSSSLKYSFFDTAITTNAAHGLIERIGTIGTRLVHNGPAGKVERSLSHEGHREAIEVMLRELKAKDAGVIDNVADITAVGHRVVHGGEKFSSAVIIDDTVLSAIEALDPIAPLHNPVNVVGIREARRVFPNVPHVAVFDTAFHQTLPAHAFLYGLPYEYYENKAIRRYGFHGTSHAYVSLCAAQFRKRSLEDLRIVSCHLGNGASVCAIDRGRSVDTSMGFTPGEGLIMGTRCGDLDSGVFAYLERVAGLTGARIDDMLNKSSGLLGLSGISSDMREIEKAAQAGNQRAALALEAFCYRVRKFIGAYFAAMGGMDVLIFTAGIGQGSAAVRRLSLEGLRCMGVQLDEERNRNARGFAETCAISADGSPVTVLVVPTNEEWMIARETLKLIAPK